MPKMYINVQPFWTIHRPYEVSRAPPFSCEGYHCVMWHLYKCLQVTYQVTERIFQTQNWCDSPHPGVTSNVTYHLQLVKYGVTPIGALIGVTSNVSYFLKSQKVCMTPTGSPIGVTWTLVYLLQIFMACVTPDEQFLGVILNVSVFASFNALCDTYRNPHRCHIE